VLGVEPIQNLRRRIAWQRHSQAARFDDAARGKRRHHQHCDSDANPAKSRHGQSRPVRSDCIEARYDVSHAL